MENVTETEIKTETKVEAKTGQQNTLKGAILRVSGKKGAEVRKSLASAIQATYKNYGYAELRCIGDPAIANAMFAAAIASGPLKQIGVNLSVVPSFDETIIDGDKKTVMVLTCEAL